MSGVAYRLRLIEDRLAPGGRLDDALPVLDRVLYVVEGELGLPARVVPAGDASLVRDPSALRAGAGGALVLRFELCAEPPPSIGGGRLVLEQAMALDPGVPWLVRCDRVDFAPGGVALPHRHRGGGIRRLLRGRLEVTVGDGAPRLMGPGDAWFESGREPVLAVAGDLDTSFVRVAVLPAEIRGQSSILYVDPSDARRSRPRTYTVHIDEPIVLY